MLHDAFIQEYLIEVRKDIAEKVHILKTKRFTSLDEVTRLQGHIEGCEAALVKLEGIADRLDI